MAVLCAWPLGASAQALAAGDQEIAFDVALETSVIDDSGSVLQRRPPVRYRVTQTTVRGKRSMTMTYLAPDQRQPGEDDPDEGVRVEYDEGTRALRMFDRTGKELGVGEPPLASPQATGFAMPVDAAASIITPAAPLASRLSALQQELGRPVGRFKALDRYLAHRGDATLEVLVAPDTGMPVEINMQRHGVVESRVTLEYERRHDGSLLQRRRREESIVPNRANERFVTETTVTGVTTGPSVKR